MGPNDPNFEAKLFSLSKQLEQLIQVPDWVMLKSETGAGMQHMQVDVSYQAKLIIVISYMLAFACTFVILDAVEEKKTHTLCWTS